MPRDPIQKAVDVLVRLESEQAQELRKTQKTIRVLNKLLADGRESPVSQPGPPRGGSVIKPAIQQYLEGRTNEWVHANVILESLLDQGVVLSAIDPKASVVTALIRMERATAPDAEGVQRRPGNLFRWFHPVGPRPTMTEPTEPGQPSEQSLNGAQASAATPESSRP